MKKIMLRDRYMQIFAETFKCITATQAQHMYFTGLKSGRIEASKRLNMLVDKGKLKKSQIGITSEVQYYPSVKQTRHQVKLLDYVAAQYELGYTNIVLKPEFSVEYQVMQTKHYARVDGVLEMEKDGIKYRNYIEIDFTHAKSLKQYEIIASDLFLKYYKRLRSGKDDGYVEQIVVVKKYLKNDYTEIVDEMDMSVEINRIVWPYLKESYCFKAHFLPWDTESFFFPEEAILIKAAAKVKKEKKIALKLKRQIEKDLLNPVPVVVKKVVKIKKVVVKKVVKIVKPVVVKVEKPVVESLFDKMKMAKPVAEKEVIKVGQQSFF